MADRFIDVAKNVSIDDVPAAAGSGTVTNDVRVVIADGTTEEEVYNTLTAVRDAIMAGRVTV